MNKDEKTRDPCNTSWYKRKRLKRVHENVDFDPEDLPDIKPGQNPLKAEKLSALKTLNVENKSYV